MNGREWQPGDVRLATVNGERMLVLRGRGIFEGNWYTQGPVAGSRLHVSDSWLLDDRPLVAIDPEDREQVERLRDLASRLADDVPYSDGIDAYTDAFAAALREFADPTPPKPAEPQGLGAVVEDANGVKYVRAGITHDGAMEDCWRHVTGSNIGYWSRYANIAAVRVLSEGVAS